MAASLRCVCGYVFQKEFARDRGHVSGEDEFPCLQGLWQPNEFDDDTRVEIYACPKCGTLKIWVESDNDDGRRTHSVLANPPSGSASFCPRCGYRSSWPGDPNGICTLACPMCDATWKMV